MFSFGDRLKIFRTAVGINQVQLAEKCNVSVRAVQKWENNENPFSMNVAEILVQMGANPSFILCGSGDILLEKIAL